MGPERTRDDRYTRARSHPAMRDQETIDSAAEWRSRLSGIVGALLLYTSVSGILIYLLPFSIFNQLNVLVHSLVGVAMLLPAAWFVVRHWYARKKGNLSHYQLLGYVSLAALCLCLASGLVLTWQGLDRPRISYTWGTAHLISGIGLSAFVLIHLLTVILRKTKESPFVKDIRRAQRRYYAYALVGTAGLFAVAVLWTATYEDPQSTVPFDADYNWRFGEDRPFAPSLARLDYADWNDNTRRQVRDLLAPDMQPRFDAAMAQQKDTSLGLFRQIRTSVSSLEPGAVLSGEIEDTLHEAARWIKEEGAIESADLAGSDGCGTDGCHGEIYAEWLPGAHRYSSMDDMFQRVQVLMAAETSPEHTRYCAGCHDPISLFGGAKNSGNITLSADGSNEGTSCLVCHSIVQADVQGNGDYTVRLPTRYVYESADAGLAKTAADFLIRTYPEHHITSYSRPLYKTEEFCAACHKQYLDREVNTDIGKVQGQNQYDSWKNSRWYHEGNEEKTIGCRECHMPLADSSDPARGDVTDYNRNGADGKHRSHRFLAGNQYIPLLQNLEGAQEHVDLTEKWLRGDIAIPEIEDKWTDGPVVRLDIQAPSQATAGEDLSIRVILTNNKTGHDFPTGPLDMIESWVEIKVTDTDNNVIYHTGALDDEGNVSNPSVIYKSDGFDRQGELIDRHNLWDLVGSSYKRSVYPGVTDAVEARFQCPSMARARLREADAKQGSRSRDYVITADSDHDNELTVNATLWYRKANPEFLDRVYGIEDLVRSPVTAMSHASTTIGVRIDGAEGH